MIWKFNRKLTFLTLSLIALISLIYAQYLTGVNPEAAFFLLPSRIWELLIGSLTAIYLFDKKWVAYNKLHEMLGFIGLGLIVIAIIFFNQGTQHPSFYTSLPIAGTVLIFYLLTTKTLLEKFLVINL